MFWRTRSLANFTQYALDLEVPFMLNQKTAKNTVLPRFCHKKTEMVIFTSSFYCNRKTHLRLPVGSFLGNKTVGRLTNDLIKRITVSRSHGEMFKLLCWPSSETILADWSSVTLNCCSQLIVQDFQFKGTVCLLRCKTCFVQRLEEIKPSTTK